MLSNPSYSKHWEEKKANYEREGISEIKGNLIINEDGLDGSLDAQLIEEKIKKWMITI